MFRNLPVEAFDQIQAITKPYIGKLPPVDNGKPIIGDYDAQAAREQAKALLRCDPNTGWPIEALFRLIKIAESALVLRQIHSDQIQILWALWDTVKSEERICELEEKENWSKALGDRLIRSEPNPD